MEGRGRREGARDRAPGRGAKRAEGSGESVGERGNGEGWRKRNGCRSEMGWREGREIFELGLCLVIVGVRWRFVKKQLATSEKPNKYVTARPLR